MPPTTVIFFQEGLGQRPPLIDWLDSLPEKAQQKCLARLKRLEDFGHELRRPEADYLRDGIYELRASYQGVHYRMLYFFSRSGRDCHFAWDHEGARSIAHRNRPGTSSERVLRGEPGPSHFQAREVIWQPKSDSNRLP